HLDDCQIGRETAKTAKIANFFCDLPPWPRRKWRWPPIGVGSTPMVKPSTINETLLSGVAGWVRLWTWTYAKRSPLFMSFTKTKRFSPNGSPVTSNPSHELWRSSCRTTRRNGRLVSSPQRERQELSISLRSTLHAK